MNYSTGLKKGSRKTGHRRRTKIGLKFKTVPAPPISWLSYKIIRQYYNEYNMHENGYWWLEAEPRQKAG